MKTRTTLALACSVIGLTLSATATAGTPQQDLQTVAEEAIALASTDAGAKAGDLKNIRVLIEKKVLPIVDRDSLGRLALGKRWRGLNEAERQEVSTVLIKMLTKTYARALAEGAGAKIQLSPARLDEAGEGKVAGKITKSNGQTISVSFDVSSKNDKTLVKDLAIEGVSIIGAMRSSIESVIEKKGYEGMLEDLKAKANS